ncbi:MAG: hypothetical protein M3Y24_10145 [Acidobacteriota bacterium]|nr:hypothetical protein [Acidobacteriota bacterium]
MNTQDPETGYAYWISPDGSSTIIYSVGLLQAIDASVNEAFRSIPRGGVETGGLLFGKRNEEGLRVEAYRPIQCQHAFGPSFVLSEQDLAGLRDQISSAASDSELSGLRPIGWFVGHTRSPFLMTDREVGWFNEFFPEPGSVALLVKPERFQPTRFGFLFRDSACHMERDATQRAVILPSQGQGTEPNKPPVASIPASLSQTNRAQPSAPDAALPPETHITSRTVAAPVESAILDVPSLVNVPETRPVMVPGAVPEVASIGRTGAGFQHGATVPRRYEVEVKRSFSGLNLQSTAVLILAAILGCVAGYWAYLQLPSPVIPVTIREQSGRLVVEWPSAQTTGPGYAALQVNDGQMIPLTEQQKLAGEAVIAPPSGDVKIDLIAKHWLRDSRGIVRYLRTAKTPLSAIPPR